jgi:hypothetical protein
MMKNTELKQLQDALKNATKGPSVSFIEGRDHSSGSSFIQTGETNYDIDFFNLRHADQDFIAIARNFLPQLIDEVLRLQKILPENEIPFLRLQKLPNDN